MKYFRGLKISLVAKLVLAFVLVAVIPMLVASKITTELIADVVNRNIERWLGEATTYMRHSVEETHERLKAVSRLLDTRFEGKTTLNKREAAALSFMDIDALWLRDAEGGLLYATLPEGRIAEPLYPGALFSWVLMADGTRPSRANGHSRRTTARSVPSSLPAGSASTTRTAAPAAR